MTDEGRRTKDEGSLAATVVVRPSSVVMMSGLPGTGKTTVARRLAEAIGATLVQSDAVRWQLFPQPTWSPEEHARVFAVCHELIADLLRRGQAVVFDATNLREAYRRPIYEIAERAGAPLFVVKTWAPEEVVRERLARRVEAAPPGYVEADWRVYQHLRRTVERISRRHFVVDTSREVERRVQRIARIVAGAAAPAKPAK